MADFVHIGKVERSHVKDIDIVHCPLPFVPVVEGLCVDVRGLSIRLRVDDGDQVVVCCLLHACNVDAVGSIEMPHGWVTPRLDDPDHRLIVLMKDDVRVGVPGDALPKV